MTRVLAVDDADDIRLLLGAVLDRAGFEVELACSGRGALLALDGEEPPDLVILDVQMPDLDGWDTLAAIRTHARHRELPVVMCSVKAGEDDLRRAWGLGCDDYITKPFSVSDLVARVHAVLGCSPADRAARRAEWAAHIDSALRLSMQERS